MPASGQNGISPAAMFGARPWAQSASLAPDGKHLVFVAPAEGAGTAAMVLDLATGNSQLVTTADGNPLNISGCGWSSNSRIVCKLDGIAVADAVRMGWSRLIAIDSDGRNGIDLGRGGGDRINQFDGEVIDWLSGADGNVLIQRNAVPDAANSRQGLEVDRVDTRKGFARMEEAPKPDGTYYLTDGAGNIRIFATRQMVAGRLTGVTSYHFRAAGSRDWIALGTSSTDGSGLRPIAVDGKSNIAYALKKVDGRDALYSIALDDTLATKLIYQHPLVDVDDVVRLGRRGRVIGLTYVTDSRHVKYFDPVYAKLDEELRKALPSLPLIYFEDATPDEKKLLIFASSDVDPGHFYLLDRSTMKMTEVLLARPQLAGAKLSPVRTISYKAADGVEIPGYLTLPPGGASKASAAIVLPHGGPSARDEWGFDWLAEYFAQRGYVVLQPEFRSSSGFGDTWFNKNGFHSWRTAVNDVNDAGRWLVQQGMADPSKLAIVGWSYGGYAALQANVVDPSLFKAVVAVAPVTDFDLMRSQFQYFTDSNLASGELGGASVAQEGSPDRHADRFQAPVLMFHGDQDINVDIAESRAMDKALKRAGKQSELVVYKGLDHQLGDSAARTDMLAKADSFLRAALKISAP